MIAGLAWRPKDAGGVLISDKPFGLVDGTGDDFQLYKEAIPAPDDLNAYAGWDGPWVHGNNYLGVQCVDDFQNAPLGTPTNLNTGTGWDGPWYEGENYLNQLAQDSMQSYAAGSIY